MPRTGGPADVITDADDPHNPGTGILFEPTPEGWREGLARALALHEQPERCAAVRHRGLAVDSTWQHYGPAYAELYRNLV
jgi:glycogen synthase